MGAIYRAHTMRPLERSESPWRSLVDKGLSMADTDNDARDAITVLPDSVPVTMPDLPLQRVISTEQQFKAISDPTRSRILGIIQNQPATAKQIADRLAATPGAIGHHLRILEAAGMAQVVARRMTRGIVANYYTRTARIFKFDLPPAIAGDISVELTIINTARDELVDALAETADDPYASNAFPHVRLAPERAKAYHERLNALVEDILREPYDPTGDVYGILVALFKSPAYLQTTDDRR
jgi:DNA-binding transcriptional ArsR family regulator